MCQAKPTPPWRWHDGVNLDKYSDKTDRQTEEDRPVELECCNYHLPRTELGHRERERERGGERGREVGPVWLSGRDWLVLTGQLRPSSAISGGSPVFKPALPGHARGEIFTQRNWELQGRLAATFLVRAKTGDGAKLEGILCGSTSVLTAAQPKLNWQQKSRSEQRAESHWHSSQPGHRPLQE